LAVQDGDRAANGHGTRCRRGRRWRPRVSRWCLRQHERVACGLARTKRTSGG